MTLREKQVVSAYTGILMCDFSDFHAYAEEVMGVPIWTHEFASKSLMDELKEKSKEEFLKICAER